MTTEERRAAAAKGAETRRRHHELEKQVYRAAHEDRVKALEICRRIRDSETATDADKLEAVKLIEKLKSH